MIVKTEIEHFSWAFQRQLRIELRKLADKDWQVQARIEEWDLEFVCSLPSLGIRATTESLDLTSITLDDIDRVAKLQAHLIYRLYERKLSTPKLV